MKTKKKPRRGAWRKDAAALKSEKIQFGFDAAERAGITTAAGLAGLSLCAWVRERLRKVAADELRAAGRPVPFLEVGGG